MTKKPKPDVALLLAEHGILKPWLAGGANPNPVITEAIMTDGPREVARGILVSWGTRREGRLVICWN